MDREDEILTKLVGENDMPYIDDNGFTQGVLHALPARRMSPAKRRTLLITSAALVGSLLAAVLAWPELTQFAENLPRVSAFLSHVTEAGIHNPILFLVLGCVLCLPAFFLLGEESR